MIGPVRAEESRASPGRQFPLGGGGRWAWERSLEPLSHLEGLRARDDLVRGDEGPHPRWMIGPVREECVPEGEQRGRGARGGADIWGNARSPGWNASRGIPDAVNSGPPPPRRAARPRPRRSPSGNTPPTGVFPEGENRGARGARGAEIWGKARSLGWNASRGTPVRRSFRPPPSPQLDPESSVRVGGGGSEVSWSRGLLPIFLDGRHTGGRPSACTNPTSAPEGRGWQDAD